MPNWDLTSGTNSGAFILVVALTLAGSALRPCSETIKPGNFYLFQIKYKLCWIQFQVVLVMALEDGSEMVNLVSLTS